MTIEIGCTGRIHRVVADLDAPRRPPELDDLIATIERMPTALAPARPPQAPPTQRSLPPLPRQDAIPRQDAAAGRVSSAGPVSSRFAQPPPPLPPAAVPLPTGHQRAAGSAPPIERAEPRSAPQPDVRPLRSGPGTPPPLWTPPPAQTPPPVYTPPPLPPEPHWNPPSEPEPRHRGRTVLLAVVTALVVGAGVTTWLLLNGGGDDGGGGGASGASSTTEPAPTTPPTAEATAAWLGLPGRPRHSAIRRWSHPERSRATSIST